MAGAQNIAAQVVDRKVQRSAVEKLRGSRDRRTLRAALGWWAAWASERRRLAAATAAAAAAARRRTAAVAFGAWTDIAGRSVYHRQVRGIPKPNPKPPRGQAKWPKRAGDGIPSQYWRSALVNPSLSQSCSCSRLSRHRCFSMTNPKQTLIHASRALSSWRTVVDRPPVAGHGRCWSRPPRGGGCRCCCAR
jgi:hypothetical protein